MGGVGELSGKSAQGASVGAEAVGTQFREEDARTGKGVEVGGDGGSAVGSSQTGGELTAAAFPEDEQNVGTCGAQEHGCLGDRIRQNRGGVRRSSVRRSGGIESCEQAVGFGRGHETIELVEALHLLGGSHETEDRIDGRMIQELAFAEVGIADVHGGFGQSSSQADEEQAAQQSIADVAEQDTQQAMPEGLLLGTVTTVSKARTPRDQAQKPEEQGGAGEECQDGERDEAEGDTGNDVLGAVDVCPDGGIELETPEGIKGDVTYNAGDGRQGCQGVEGEEHPAQHAPGGCPVVGNPAAEPGQQQQIGRRGEIHGQPMP